jgi:hypothetical protein
MNPEKQLHVARHQALLAEVRRRRPKESEFGEMLWETTLSEITAGEFDGVLGLRLFIARLQAANEKQAFLDAAVVKIIQGLTDPSERKRFAKEAYDTAEDLWNERRRRLQGLPYVEPTKDEGIPF